MNEKITSQLKKLSKGDYEECIVEDLVTQQTIHISLEDFEAIQEFMKWYDRLRMGCEKYGRI